MNTRQSRKKRAYSSFTKYCCLKGDLPKEIEKSISRSTRHSWNKQWRPSQEDCTLARFEREWIDYAELLIKNEKINIASAALAEIIIMHQKVINSCSGKKQLLTENKHLILETIERLKSVFSLKQICSYVGISTRQYHSWKNNADCRASLLKLCRKKFPTQLTNEGVEVIKNYMDNEEFRFLSRATVYWKIIRDGSGIFSKSAFYKYCRLLGYHKRPVITKSKHNTHGIKADAPGEILHTDITHLVTSDDKTSYLSFIEDNFSKYILNGQAAKAPGSAFIRNCMEGIAEKYGLLRQGTMLITDNGGENKGELDTWLTKTRTITKVIARVDIPQANNVVEALHKKFKNEFLQGKRFANHEALVAALPNLIEAYNNQYHDSLFGYSPLEVWNSAIPDKNRYRPLLATANEYRKRSNKQFNCCTNIRTF